MSDLREKQRPRILKIYGRALSVIRFIDGIHPRRNFAMANRPMRLGGVEG